MESQQRTRKTSISRKLMLWLVSITMIIMFVFGLMNYFIFVNQIENDLDYDLERNMQTLEDDLNLHMWNLNIRSIREISETHPSMKLLSFLRVENNFGETIYEVDNRLEDEDYLLKEKIVLYEGEDVGVIEIASPMESVAIAKQVIIRSTVVIILAVFFAVLFISFFVARSISKPIRNISDVSQEIAKGNLDKKVEVTTSDEVGQLGSAFNIMTSKLKVSRKKLEDYSKNLEVKVKERTKELGVKNEELERFTKFTVGREKKIVELKNQLRGFGVKFGAVKPVVEKAKPVEKIIDKPVVKKVVKPVIGKPVKKSISKGEAFLREAVKPVAAPKSQRVPLKGKNKVLKKVAEKI